MRIAQIVLAVLAVVSSVSARGYGPGVGSPGGSYGGIGSGIGGRFGGGGGGYSVIGGTTGRGSFAAGGLSGAAGRGGYISGGYASVTGVGAGIYGQSMVPIPYEVNYEAPDGQGGVQFKRESGDGSGSVQGTYGYRDAQGLYRVVEYVADQNGFRAAVNTNEPGVDGKENPADVSMNVEKTPAGIQEKYTPVASPFGAGPASGVSGGGLFGRGGPSGGYPGRTGGGFGGPASGVSGGGLFGMGGLTGGYPGRTVGGFGGSVSGVSGGGLFGMGGATRGYAGRSGGGFGGSAIGGRGLTGGYGSVGGISSVPGAPGSFGVSSGLFSGIPRSTTGKSAY